MKNIYKIFFLIFIAFGISSCVENENFKILPAQDSFEIETSSGSVIVLDDTNLANTALFLSWSTTSGTTTIEAAVTGTDFATPFVLGTTENSNFSMTVGALNAFLLDTMDLPAAVATSLDLRIMNNGKATKTISVVVTPFKVEFTEMFVVGNITDPAWSPADALPMPRLGFNVFEITLNLAEGAEFKFLPTNTGWDGDWGQDPNNPGKIIVDGEQNIAGLAAGKYKIKIDLNTFDLTIAAIVSPENLFLVGSLTGWDPTTSLPFLNNGNNVFTIYANIPDGAEFKFLPTNTGWDGDWGASKTTPGTVVVDDEDNLKGYAAGKYLITVDFNTFTYNLSLINNLFLVGSLTGWDPGTSLPMGEASLGVFSKVIDLADGDEFKFLPQNTGWDGDWGASKTTTGSIVVNDEDNLKGFAAGKYVVAVNFNTLTYTVSALNGVPANLFLVGSFRGWSNDANNPQFTQTSPGVFEINQALTANDEFKFVRVAGSWDDDLGVSGTNNGVIEQNGENNIKVTNTATYGIIVNFNTGTITLAN